MYVIYILNITANSGIGNISPDQHLYGQTPDISPTLRFQFYKPVYYSDIDSSPAPVENKGRWDIFAPNIGDMFMFSILTNDTHYCIIYHSAVHSTLNRNEKKLCLKFSDGEDDPHRPVKQVLHTWDK